MDGSCVMVRPFLKRKDIKVGLFANNPSIEAAT